MNYSVVALLASLSAVAASTPGPAAFSCGTITYGGSGCPQGTLAQSLSADRTTFTLIYDQFVASITPNGSITDSRKNCQINVPVNIPQGWQFATESTDYRGYVQLDSGIHAQHKSIYYFAGQSQQVSTTCDFYGRTSRDYLDHQVIGIQSWSPCGGTANLNINAQVRLFNEGGNPNAQGQITNDSTDGHFQQELGFTWRRC